MCCVVLCIYRARDLFWYIFDYLSCFVLIFYFRTLIFCDVVLFYRIDLYIKDPFQFLNALIRDYIIFSYGSWLNLKVDVDWHEILFAICYLVLEVNHNKSLPMCYHIKGYVLFGSAKCWCHVVISVINTRATIHFHISIFHISILKWEHFEQS